jgi:hypothetical protein
MAINAFLDANPSAPDHGDTLTVTYTVTGNDPTSPSTARISGHVVVGGQGFDVGTNITLPGSPAADVSYEVPECPGLTFAATGEDNVFTAAVP